MHDEAVKCLVSGAQWESVGHKLWQTETTKNSGDDDEDARSSYRISRAEPKRTALMT